MSLKQNLKLLVAIRENGLRQKAFAELVGDPPAYVSRICNGWMVVDDDRKKKYAKALNRRIEEIFPSRGSLKQIRERIIIGPSR